MKETLLLPAESLKVLLLLEGGEITIGKYLGQGRWRFQGKPGRVVAWMSIPSCPLEGICMLCGRFGLIGRASKVCYPHCDHETKEW